MATGATEAGLAENNLMNLVTKTKKMVWAFWALGETFGEVEESCTEFSGLETSNIDHLNLLGEGEDGRMSVPNVLSRVGACFGGLGMMQVMGDALNVLLVESLE